MVSLPLLSVVLIVLSSNVRFPVYMKSRTRTACTHSPLSLKTQGSCVKGGVGGCTRAVVRTQPLPCPSFHLMFKRFLSQPDAPVCSDVNAECTACSDCCHSYIPSGVPCSDCVKEKCSSPSQHPSRLTINGSQMLDPSGAPIRLTGFNWQLGT